MGDGSDEEELAICDDAPDGTAAEVDSEELDGSAELGDPALGPTDWSVAAEAEDATAMLLDETESDVDDGTCVEDVTDDDGAAVVE